MEINRRLIVGVGLHDTNRPLPSQNCLFADIVFLDKSQQGLAPILYQPKISLPLEQGNEQLVIDEIKNKGKNGFVFVGEVENIDKKQKKIYLTNGLLVFYNYLIIARGLRGNPSPELEKELVSGLQPLVDALKIKKEMPVVIFGPKNKESIVKTSSRIISLSKKPKKEIERVAFHYMMGKEENPFASYLNSLEKRLYEVHF